MIPDTPYTSPKTGKRLFWSSVDWTVVELPSPALTPPRGRL